MKVIFVGGIASDHRSEIKEPLVHLKVTIRDDIDMDKVILLSRPGESVAYGTEKSECYVLKHYVFVGADQRTHEYGFYMSSTAKQSDIAMAIQRISWEVSGYKEVKPLDYSNPKLKWTEGKGFEVV